MWVTHSLGTIVGFNILRKAENVNASCFVTLGSPLGLATVIEKLKVRNHMPEGAKRWFNAYDSRDVVALLSVAEKIKTEPPIEEMRVTNPNKDAHAITGYLSVPEIASTIAAALKRTY